MTDNEKSNWESFKVTGDEILTKVKEIIKDGNARRIIIKNEKDETIMEFPLTIGAIGVVLAPLFAAIGTLAALATNCTILVEKKVNNEGEN
jgi:repressor of nif and glnA expression